MSTNELSNKIRGALFVFLAFFTTCLPVGMVASTGWAATYYVNGSTGNNSYNGLYPSFQGGSDGPWKTIQKAADTVPSGSHLITVAAGTYAEKINETTSGTDVSNTLHYLANGTVNIQQFKLSGNYIELEGFTITSVDCGNGVGGGVRVFGDGCTVKSCIVQDCLRVGIIIEPGSDGAIIRGNTIRRNASEGVYISDTTSNALLENNDISDTRCTVSGCSTTRAVGVSIHGSGHIVRGNYIHDILFSNNPGCAPHIDAFQTWNDGSGDTTDCIFEKNHIYLMEDALSGVVTVYGFMLAGSSNITIRNNLIETWGGINTGGGGVSNLKIYNNTFRSSLSFTSAYWPKAMGIVSVATAEIYNNITVDFPYRHYEISGSNISYDYNLMWNSNSSTPALTGYTVQAHDQRSVNPLFVTNFTDFHLQLNSPCIDAGITVSQVTDDFDGKQRPQGTGYDIGAYEFISASPPRPSPPKNLKVLN